MAGFSDLYDGQKCQESSIFKNRFAHRLLSKRGLGHGHALGHEHALANFEHNGLLNFVKAVGPCRKGSAPGLLTD